MEETWDLFFFLKNKHRGHLKATVLSFLSIVSNKLYIYTFSGMKNCKKTPLFQSFFLQLHRNDTESRLPKMRHVREVPTAWHCAGPCAKLAHTYPRDTAGARVGE